MKRITVRLVIALLTFVIGVSLVAFWLLNQQTSAKSLLEVENAAAESLIQQHIEFNGVSMADGIILTGGNFASQSYESSYGVRVSFSQEGYSSSERAREAFEEKLKNAVSILERNRKYVYGLQMGERIVGVFAYSEPKEQVSSIIWLEGSVLYTISSPSLRHALAFERNKSR